MLLNVPDRDITMPGNDNIHTNCFSCLISFVLTEDNMTSTLSLLFKPIVQQHSTDLPE